MAGIRAIMPSRLRKADVVTGVMTAWSYPCDCVCLKCGHPNMQNEETTTINEDVWEERWKRDRIRVDRRKGTHIRREVD